MASKYLISSPLTRREIAAMIVGAESAGVPIAPDRDRMPSPMTADPNMYSMFVFRGFNGLRLLDAAYPWAIKNPKKSDLRDFYKVVQTRDDEDVSDGPCVSIEFGKFKTGPFQKRYIAQLSLMCGGKQMPLGVAAADNISAAWWFVARAIKQGEPLPFNDVSQAIQGMAA